MTIRTLALASATTSIQDHRLALGAFMGPGASVLERRGGVQYYPGAADLVSASSLQANVTPFLAIVDGTSNALQGQIPVVVDANVTLTFSAGEAAVARTDRVVLQVRDNTYDASGFTDARVLIVKGNTSTGAANSVPASSLLLWEVVVPIGASSITFSSARVDRRQWIASPLRVPVNSQTERDALPAMPCLEVTRLDTGNVEQYWSGAWRIIAPSAASPSAAVSRQISSFSPTTTMVLGAAIPSGNWAPITIQVPDSGRVLVGMHAEMFSLVTTIEGRVAFDLNPKPPGTWDVYFYSCLAMSKPDNPLAAGGNSHLFTGMTPGSLTITPWYITNAASTGSDTVVRRGFLWATGMP